METRNVRRLLFILTLLPCILASVCFGADATFKLNNGQTIVGEVLTASANDAGIQIKVGDGKYERVPWSSFSQEDLKQFAQTKKLEPLVEPFIEVTQEQKLKKTEVNIKEPPRLERPPAKSFFGAMFGSGLGVFIVLLLYAANIYAAYEIAVFRAQPVPMVCGVAAIAPLLGPIIFLSMPTKVQRSAQEEPTWETAPAAQAAEAVNPMQGAQAAEHPGGLHIAHEAHQPAAPSLPPTQTFPRGQFTFNRRFFETKFPGFFAVVRREAEKDMVLVFKASRGQFVGQRITRIAANDLHLQVQKGAASEEVMIPFSEIQEIRLQHKDAQ